MKRLWMAVFCVVMAAGGVQATVLVDSVIADGAAERAGLRSGDRIEAIAGKEIETLADLRAALAAHRPGETVTVRVYRDGGSVDLPIQLGERQAGGASMGVRLAVPHQQADGDRPPADAAEIGEATGKCLQWVEDTYHPDAFMRRLALDLADVFDQIKECVGGDVRAMGPARGVRYCDNIFKVHCSGIDLLTEIGEAILERCETRLAATLDPEVRTSRDWQTCGKQRVFDRYTHDGEFSDTAACHEAYRDGCDEPHAHEPGAAAGPAGTAGDNPSAPEPVAWRQWGGPHQDFAAPAVGIAGSWPEAGPGTLWRRHLGEGYSAILYDEGKLFTMYRTGRDEVVVCLDAATGETLWESAYEQMPGGRHVASFGDGPNATPVLSDDLLFTVGIAGRLNALRRTDGEILWSRELWGEELAGNVLAHGYSSSPLVYGDTVVVPVGGETAGLVALEQKTGAVRWRSAPFRNSYSSPCLLTVAGSEQIVMFMAEELIGVNPQDGTLLWRYPHANEWRHNVAVPVVADGNLIFLSSPQAGARGLRISGKPGAMAVEEVWSNRRIQFYHVTSVRQGDWVYGSTGTMAMTFMAAVNIRTGEIAWRERGFAKANTVAADGKLVILDEDGVLSLASATPEELVVLGRTQLLDRVAWTVPTVVGQRLFVRNRQEILAVDLG